ncbi:ABC-2 type transport system ATP-binding protein [Hymenobacter daecheongensis DSM 21074]|uniref:ABC-2 type transport system ATP-binding protein n=1 Tax=Hymenobacter daecheongensis DSM 21074 TaxID=1121955 RepID=A0A1M6IXA1_9BACT|nr:ABC transporter ATP-binding protein [Hymenobacter daecheongensis]SHJ39042.1 ABC-2 type transport system ATP-binding protein [Hymenobacter daecheongensis DSM 21074]
MLTTELTDVRYSVADREILKGISLRIADGESVALLGANGSGKSSLLAVLLGDVLPTAGTATFNGQPFARMRKHIGVVYDQVPTYGLLKVREVLDYFSAIYGLRYAEHKELLHVLSLDGLLPKFMQVLSGGERRRVGLFLALMHRPDLLVLDEATADLDPATRELLWTRVLRRYARSILFVTHDWEEASAHADQVVFLHEGQLLLPPESPGSLLSQRYIGADKKIIMSKRECDPALLTDEVYVENEESYHVFVPDVKAFFAKVNGRMPNFSFAPKRLQDVYQYLIHA